MTTTVNRPLPLLVRRLLRPLLRVALFARGFRALGAARLPRKRRALILIANHAAWVDSVLFIAAVRPRFTVCGAKPRYFETAPRRMLMALLNILPVRDRDEFVADCTSLLAKDEIVLIYPEMGRNVGEFRTWAAEVALASGAPILPCYVGGTTRLIVGQELLPAGDAPSLTRQLFDAVAALREAA
jgi:1-acyl-sn-glycerol-3-phosphate acyltransferase